MVATALLSVGVVVWQSAHVIWYSPLVGVEVPTAQPSDDRGSDLAVVNLQFENDCKDRVADQLRELDSDLLLLIELDRAWEDALKNLASNYAHRAGVVRERGLGIALWSKLPLHDVRVEYLVTDDRASIFAEVELERGRLASFVGLHPTPPGLPKKNSDQDRHDSRMRDAELLIVASMIERQPEKNWIVAGDFNDVAWSHTTRLFKRLSGLKDPRIGRGLFNTYHAEHPWMRFPIDQVFLSSTARLHDIRRISPAGSDHFAIVSRFSFAHQPLKTSGATTIEEQEPDPAPSDRDEAEEIIDEGIEDAASTTQTAG